MANVLVVDDDRIMLSALGKILEKGGHIVSFAKDGKEAFEKIARTYYDIVVTDIMMPYANGLEVVSRLRSDDKQDSVGIMVVSSAGNEELITEAFNLGVDDYMKKPIMAGEFLNRLKRVVDSKL
ncbi:MAG: response regulator [Bacteroidota bacterium]